MLTCRKRTCCLLVFLHLSWFQQYYRMVTLWRLSFISESDHDDRSLCRLTGPLCRLLQTAWYYVEPWVLSIICHEICLAYLGKGFSPRWRWPGLGKTSRLIFPVCLEKGKLSLKALDSELTSLSYWLHSLGHMTSPFSSCEMGCLKITALAHTVPSTRAGPWWELTPVRAPTTLVRRARTFLIKRKSAGLWNAFPCWFYWERTKDGRVFAINPAPLTMRFNLPNGQESIYFLWLWFLFLSPLITARFLTYMLHYQEHCKSHSMRSFSRQEYLTLIMASGHFFSIPS